MLDIKREGAELFSEFDMAVYSKSVFGMFGGNAEFVSLLCDESLAGVIIDRFGKDVVFINRGDGKIEINVKVVLSPQFYSWVFGFGNRMTVLSPKKARDGFIDQINSVAKLYQ